MYVRCKLLLTQGDDSLEVVLKSPSSATYQDLATFWGSFSSTEGTIPPERKAWSYAFSRLELTLMDGGGPGVGMVGGGLKYGEMADVPPAATLSRALMANHGMRPSDSSGVGTGEILNPSELYVRFRRGPVKWQLVGYQGEGSNAWKSP
jgi:hypothetical protein